MSDTKIRWALSQPGLTVPQRCCLVAIAAVMETDESETARIIDLVEASCMDADAVADALAQLAVKGLASVTDTIRIIRT